MNEVAHRTKEFFAPQSTNKTTIKADGAQDKKDRIKQIVEANQKLSGQAINGIKDPQTSREGVTKDAVPTESKRAGPGAIGSSGAPEHSQKQADGAISAVSNEDEDSESEDVAILPGVSFKQMMKQVEGQLAAASDPNAPIGPQSGEIQKQVDGEEKHQLTEAELVSPKSD